MCGLVPLVILLLNVLVIAETRRLLAQQKQMTYSVRLVSTNSTTPAALAAGPQGDQTARQVLTFKNSGYGSPLFHTLQHVLSVYSLCRELPRVGRICQSYLKL